MFVPDIESAFVEALNRMKKKKKSIFPEGLEKIFLLQHRQLLTSLNIVSPAVEV